MELRKLASVLFCCGSEEVVETTVFLNVRFRFAML